MRCKISGKFIPSNLENQKFGKWLVIGKYPVRKNKNNVVWLCRCECGGEYEVRASELKRGGSKQCRKCSGKEKRSKAKFGNSAKGALLHSYKMAARRRNLTWEISDELFFELTQKFCYYCGKLPNETPITIFTRRNCPEIYVYNGIDRVDNTEGYLDSNIVTCCKICNLSKNDLSYNEFLEWIERIKKHDLR
jgi:hypothetical protein